MNRNPSVETRFGAKRGNSATAGGRPAALKGLRVKCRGIVDELVVRRWAHEVEVKGPEWVECSKLLAAYGYGKPEAFAEDDDGVQSSAGQLSASVALQIMRLARAKVGDEEAEH